MDAGAIMQNDTTIENLRAMTDATIEYGRYRSPSSPAVEISISSAQIPERPAWVSAGVCLPFEEQLKRLPPISGELSIVRDIWNDTEALAYLYIWHVLLSF